MGPEDIFLVLCDSSMSDPDRSRHISLWFLVAHSLFVEGSHMTKNMASGYV
jgi:hypothetical protein